MANFKVGQKVVCVHPQPPFLLQNEIYSITGIFDCTCGKQQVSFGVPHNISGKSYCYCNCGNIGDIDTGHYFCFSWRFRPLDHQFAEDVIKMLCEEPIEV